MGSGEEPSSSGKQALERGLEGGRENPTSTPFPRGVGVQSQAAGLDKC